jgi:RecA/RadA recombinase
LLHRSNISALSTGVPTLDRFLRGGIPIQAITELVGASGTGKTQLAMQLSIEAAKRGFGTIYIDTERKLNFPRLEEIASMRNRYNELFGRHFDNVPDSIGRDMERYRHPQDVLSNITVYSPSSSNELLTILQSLEEEILLRNEESLSLSTNSMPVRLLIVDSIAIPIQHEYFNVSVSSSLHSTSPTEKMSDKSTAAKRSALLMTIASNLKRLADQLRLYVVVINQVVAIHASRVRPALGNSWHHCISIRIQLDYHHHHNNNRTTSGEVRHAKLLKSHVAPNGVALFKITSRGLEEWNGDSKENDM